MEPNSDSACSEDCAFVSEGRDAHKVDKRVHRELFVCSGVIDEFLGAGCLRGIHESRPAPSRSGDRVDSADDDRSGFRVEQPGNSSHAVWARSDVEITSGASLLFTLRDAALVEFVAVASRKRREPFKRQRRSLLQ